MRSSKCFGIRADTISPWIESTQPPPIRETIVEAVSFPEEDESTGNIITALFGPDCKDQVLIAALNVILTYLARSSVSILRNVIVEKERLAEVIDCYWDARPNSVIWFRVIGVATEKLAFVEKRIFELIKEVSIGPINMEYMLQCVRRNKRYIKLENECSEDFIASSIINDFLFGERQGSTFNDLKTLKQYDVLERWSEADWRGFLTKWFSDAPHISILGIPSKDLVDKIKSREEARIEARKKELGPEGLKKLDQKLRAALAKNDMDIPTAQLQHFLIPDIKSIHFIESLTARSGLAKELGIPENSMQKTINATTLDLPLFIQFEHVPREFVKLMLLVGTSEVETNDLPLLTIISELFFTSPIMKNGQKIEFEEVVTSLEKDTIEYSISKNSGFDGQIAINFEVEPEKYSTAIEWIRTMVFDSFFDETRIGATIAKILASIPERKRCGFGMARAIDDMIHLDKNSSFRAGNTLVMSTYMKRLKKNFLKDSNRIIISLKNILKSLFRFNNMRALVIADIHRLQKPVESWRPLITGLDSNNTMIPITKTSKYLSSDGKDPGRYGVVVVPLSNIDSSFCISTAKCPLSLIDPVLPALKVTISYLETVEGPLWTAIRGKGLAYGVNFFYDADCLLQFYVHRSPDSYRVFEAAKALIESYIVGATKIEEHLLQGAISTIVSDLATNNSTMIEAGNSHFFNSIKGLNDDYDTNMLRAAKNVTPEQIIAVMKEILMPVFTPGKANVVLTCATIMKDTAMKNFEKVGFKTCLRELSDFYETYGLETTNDDNDEEEESGIDDDSISDLSRTTSYSSDH